jgi:hypothetical protein
MASFGIGPPALSPSLPSLGANIGNLSDPGEIANLLASASQGVSNANTPWNKSNSVVNSIFYPYIQIKPDRWNQLFPYRLAVIDTSTQGQNSIVVGKVGSLTIEVDSNQQGTSIVSFTPTNNAWVFNLPISPQQLNIVDQFAINTLATLRGVLEEHNGIKFKLINASGTMGVWPFRSSVTQPPSSPSVLQSVFGGAISAATGVLNQLVAITNTFTTDNPNSKPSSPSPGSGQNGAGPWNSTGYYQAMMLQQFLEQYAEAKKNPANASWRLVFDIQKQNQSYIVTPMQFTWQQSVQKPMEIQYQMQLKAWRRINLQEVTQAPSPAQAYTLTPGILQTLLNGITQARLTMSSAIALIGAVTSDVNGVFNILNQTSLFVKDLIGVLVTASDLPSSIKKDFNSAIQQFISINSSTIASNVTTSGGAAAVRAVVAASNANNGITQTAALNGQLGPSAASTQQVNNVAAIFNNPNSNVDLLDQVPVNELILNTAQQKKLNQILSNTTLTVAQLNNNATAIQSLATQLADYFGAGDSTYNTLFGLTPPPTQIQPMSINQFLILDTLYQFVQGISYLTATTQVTDLTLINSLNYIAGLANQSAIPFTVPTTKVYVPVPFNATIEAIAARYLGDAQRWIEIATLNNLEEPYIDESGFQLPLLSNAIGRQVIVASNQNLYFGQTVTLKGAGQVPVSLQITNITALPNGNSYLITLNGQPNLGNFTTANMAYLQAYLPNTTNSQQKIFIPSNLSPPTYPGQANIIPPGIAANDPLTGLSGVDILLTNSGDLALNNYGDFMISYGLTNLIQALYILFNTTLSSFLIHPEYGLGITPGMSVANFNVQQFYEQINGQISQDPRFSTIDKLQVQVNPPTLSISLVISLPGNNGTLPVSFQLAA